MQTGTSSVGNQGTAIILVAVLMAIMTFGLIGYQVMAISYQNIMQRLNTSGQADSVAKSGLIDALNWFRKQSPQPVANALTPDAAFAPLEVNGETIDQSLGMVKEFRISNRSTLWGRYEVLRGSSTPSGFVGVHDITDLRTQDHAAGEGYVWSIQSNGYIYRLLSTLVPYNQAPNQVVATSKVITELRRLSLILPSDAAVVMKNYSTFSITNNTKIVGGSTYGLAYYFQSGAAPVPGAGSEITGQPQPTYQIATSSAQFTPQAIFTAPQDQIRLMADTVIGNSQALPSVLPSHQIVFIDGNAAFDATHPLTGSGLVFINGNLTIATETNPVFSGLLYVTGNVTISGAAQISGAVVTQGTLTCNGGADTIVLQYDPLVVNTVRQQIGMYHLSHNIQYLFSGGIKR